MKKLLIGIIRFYRKRVSPLKKPCCRFRPTCSTFALLAVQKHGALLGGLMALARILRCNPYCRGGYDPVPVHFTLKSGVGKYSEPSVCDTCEKRDECDGERCILPPQTPYNKGETI